MKDLTKKEISKAFVELLREKNLKKITIEEISEKAHVNRQTFYYHFQDIIDLLDWIFTEKEKELLKDQNTFSNWQNSFLKIFEEFKKDKNVIINIYKNASPDLLLTNLYKLVYPIIYKVVKEKSQNYNAREEDVVFLTDFYKLSFVALVMDWLNKDMQDDPEIIISKISVLLQGTIEHSLNNINKTK